MEACPHVTIKEKIIKGYKNFHSLSSNNTLGHLILGE